MFIQMLTRRTSSVGRSDTFGLAVCALGASSCHCNFSFNDLHYFFFNILLLINIYVLKVCVYVCTCMCVCVCVCMCVCVSACVYACAYTHVFFSNGLHYADTQCAEDSLWGEDWRSNEVPDRLLQGIHHRDCSKDASIGWQQRQLKMSDEHLSCSNLSS